MNSFLASILSTYDVRDDYCLTELLAFMKKTSAEYPLLIGDDMSTQIKIKLILFLVSINYS